MAGYIGNFVEDATVHFKWSTVDSSGEPVTRSTNGTITVYKDAGTTGSVAGVTDTEDWNSKTGTHHCAIDTSADVFYATGSDYLVMVLGAIVDGVTLDAEIGSFSIENRFAEVDVVKWLGTAAATPTVAGVPEVDLTHVMGTILTEGGAGRLAAAIIKLFDVATPTLVASSVMRGTDSANTTKTGFALSTAGILAIWHQAVAQIVTADTIGKLLKDEITSARMATLTDWIDGGRLDLIQDIIAADVVNVDGIVPAAAGDLMGLSNDAITAAKYDESTAFPVKSDDSGSTQIARTGADSDTLETLSDQIDAIGGGAGAITFTYTLTDGDSGNPIADADVWVTSDIAGSTVIASSQTNQNGVVVFYLDAGTVYVWRQKTNFDFTNPDTEVVA